MERAGSRSQWWAAIAALILAAVATGSQHTTRADVGSACLDPDTTLREIRAFLDSRTPRLAAQPPALEGSDARAQILRDRLLQSVVYRGVPAAWRSGALQVQWGDTLRPAGGYSIRKLRYEAVPGMWIPALLYEPDHLVGRVPAVLNVNGHVGAPGKAIEYEQLRSINLAQRGVLSLHPEWLGCGELTSPEYSHNRLAYLDLCGRSGLAVFYLAMRRGLDILATHPRADPDRLAMTGLSGGGWQTIWLGALDTRLDAVAPNAGYIGVRERSLFSQDIGDLEQNPTDAYLHADYSHLTALLAPRPALLIYNQKDDCCFQTARARPAVYDPVTPYYAQQGRAARFRFHNNRVPGSHNYDQDNREQFYRFLNDEFGPVGDRRDVEIPAQHEVQSFEALRVGLPAGNAGFAALAEPLLPRLPLHKWSEQAGRGSRSRGTAAMKAWQSASRQRLYTTLRLPRTTEPAVNDARELPSERVEPNVTLRRRVLRIDGEWSVPVIEVIPDGVTDVHIRVADAGRPGAGAALAEAQSTRSHLVLPDLLLQGECHPRSVPRYQHSMLLGAVGARLLGLQARQLLGVIKWARRTYPNASLRLTGSGRLGSCVAAVAGALAPAGALSALQLEALLPSLKLLIEDRVDYSDAPELFAFGLLERFDIRELLEMAEAPRLSYRCAPEHAARSHLELDGVAAFRRTLGWDTDPSTPAPAQGGVPR